MVALTAKPTAYCQLPRLIPYVDSNKWGYADSTGRVVIAPQWDDADFFRNGRALVRVRTNDLHYSCIIDTLGRYIVPPWRQWNGNLIHNWEGATYNAIGKDGRWGIIDSNNHEIIPCIYEKTELYGREARVSGFFHYDEKRHGVHAVAKKDGKFGIIDTNNRTIIPFQYDGIYRPFFPETQPEYYVIQKKGKHGVIDTNNRLLVKPRWDIILFDWATPSRGIALWRHDRRVIADSTGKIILDFPGYSADFPQGGFVPVNKVNGRAGLMDTDGNIVIPCRFASVSVHGDTIEVLQDSTLPGEHVAHWFHQYFNKRTYEPITPLFTAEQLTPPAPPAAATANFHSDQRQTAPRPYHLRFTQHSREVDSIKRDGITWFATGYTWQARNVFYNLKGHGDDSTKYVGVVDTSGKFVVPPLVFDGKINHFNAKDSLLIVEHEDLSLFQGVTDYHLRAVLPFQHYGIECAFYYKKVFYAIINKGKIYPGPKEENPFQTMESGTIAVGIDGKPIPALKGYSLKSVVDVNSGSQQTGVMLGEAFAATKEEAFAGNFLAEKTAENTTGIINIDGSIAYPLASFRYHHFTPCGAGIFLVDNEYESQFSLRSAGTKYIIDRIDGVDPSIPVKGQPYLIDSNNRVLLDGLTVADATLVIPASRNSPGLLYVALKASPFFNYGGCFYMDTRGRAYFRKPPVGSK